jgi:hypothetical protein
MQRALGTLTPWETYEKAQRIKEENLLNESD